MVTMSSQQVSASQSADVGVVLQQVLTAAAATTKAATTCRNGLHSMTQHPASAWKQQHLCTPTPSRQPEQYAKGGNLHTPHAFAPFFNM
jgi:hypothetical protein